MKRYFSFLILFTWCLSFTGSLFAQDSMGFTRQQIHDMVLLHEREPLSEASDTNRGLLMAHFKPVDYIICGYIVGPLTDSDLPAHQAIMWQIIFASGDWVEENPERADMIDAYTLVGLESGLRSYQVILKSNPDARHPALDELSAIGANKFNQENPCRTL